MPWEGEVPHAGRSPRPRRTKSMADRRREAEESRKAEQLILDQVCT